MLQHKLLIGTYCENSSITRRRYILCGLNADHSGNLITSGQTAGFGVPHKRLITDNKASSSRAWNRAFLVNNSPRIHLSKTTIIYSSNVVHPTLRITFALLHYIKGISFVVKFRQSRISEFLANVVITINTSDIISKPNPVGMCT